MAKLRCDGEDGKCGCDRFTVQVPPKSTPDGLKYICLLCVECQKVYKIRAPVDFRELREKAGIP